MKNIKHSLPAYSEKVLTMSYEDKVKLTRHSVNYYWAYLDFEKAVLGRLCSIVRDCDDKARHAALKHWWNQSIVFSVASKNQASGLRYKAVPATKDKMGRSEAFWSLNEATQLSKLSEISLDFFDSTMRFVLALSKRYVEMMKESRPLEDAQSLKDAMRDALFFAVDDAWYLPGVEEENIYCQEVSDLAQSLIQDVQGKLRKYIFSDKAIISPFAFLKEDGQVDWDRTYPLLKAFGVKKFYFNDNGGARPMNEPMPSVGTYLEIIDSYNRAFNKYNATKFCLHPLCTDRNPLPPAKKGDVNLHEECQQRYKKIRKYHTKPRARQRVDLS